MKQKIKLFIHDTFFEAFADLPKQIQKKTREFMRKFREDPTSNAINYEKISTFIDQSLRTVRIDQKYRAIVKAPDRGDGYTLLHVGNHDEAMDWAMNKVFEFNPSTQAYQLYERPIEKIAVSVDEKIAVVDVDNIESSLGDTFTDEQLLKLGTPESLLAQVKALRNLSDLESLNTTLPSDNYEYLYYLLEGVSIQEIIEDIEQGFLTDKDDLSTNAKRSLFVVTDDAQIEEYLSGDIEKWKVFLHPSQRSLAFGEFKGPVKILGGAGTGKTVCAIHRLKYLTSTMGIYDRPILFTTYTKSLSQYLSQTVSQFKLDPSRYLISNFDQVVFKLAKEYKVIPLDAGLLFDEQEERLWLEVLKSLPSSRDPRFLSDEYNQVILTHQCHSLEDYLKASRIGRSVRIGRKDKIEIWEQYQDFLHKKANLYSKNELCNLLLNQLLQNNQQPFSHVICDELQDFGSIELRLIRKLVPEANNDLFFVGDPFQNIYGKRLNFSDSGINVKGRRSKKLKVNYRTTEEIKQFAVRTITNISKDDFDGSSYDPKGYLSLIHGDVPTYQVFDDFKNEVNYLIGRLENVRKSFDDGSICIASRTNTYLDKIKSVLSESNIEFEDLGKEHASKQTLKLSTFHNLKGHEFKVVFLVGVSASTVPFTNFPAFEFFDEVQKEDHINSEKSLVYVAISRAIHSLSISGVGDKCDFIQGGK